MIINLNPDNKRHDAGTVDYTQALVALHTAEEGFTLECTKYELLVNACENIEAGLALGNAIAAKGDSNTGVAVATESLRQNLKIIGQEHLTSSVVTPGTESITAATEGITEILKKAWEAVKSFAIKIWKWITGLFKKVTDAVSGAVGSGSSLDKLVTELREIIAKGKDGKTAGELTTDSEKLSTMAKPYMIYGTVVGGKFGAEGIKNVLSYIAAAPIELGILDNVTQAAEALANDVDSLKADKIAGMFKHLTAPTEKFDTGKVKYLKDVEADLKKKAGFDSNNSESMQLLTASFNSRHISVLVLTVSDAAKKALDELKAYGADASLTEVSESIDAVVKGYKTKLIEVSAEDLGLKPSAFTDRLKSLTAKECLDVVNELIKTGEHLVRKTSDTEKVLNDTEKKASKAFKDLDTAMRKNLTDDSEISSAGKSILSASKAFNEITLKIARDVSKVTLTNTDNILKSDIITIVNESIKVFP